MVAKLIYRYTKKRVATLESMLLLKITIWGFNLVRLKLLIYSQPVNIEETMRLTKKQNKMLKAKF